MTTLYPTELRAHVNPKAEVEYWVSALKRGLMAQAGRWVREALRL